MVKSMASKSPLDEWKFLIGTWKGETEGGQFGIKGTIEGIGVYSREPGEMFIMARGENRSEGQLLHKSISILFYDDIERKLKRKTFFSYGFVHNEVECARTKNEIKFDITYEPLPKQYERTRWRSFIRKISNKKIATGLEVAKEGEDFKRYGESILEKTK
jgi:hypothetical protein